LKRTTIAFFSVILCLSFSTDIYCQAGIEIYGGISDAKNKSISITPEGTSHAGWHAGVDARLNEGKMYFIAGLQYHVIDFIAQEDKSYFSSDESYSWTKVRVGLGYNVINFNKNVFFRGHTLLSFNLINGVPSESPNTTITNYNSGTAGINLGLGFDIYNFTVGAAYEIGFFKLVTMMPETEMDFLTFSIGYKI